MRIVEQHRGIVIANILPLILVWLEYSAWQKQEISWQVFAVIAGWAFLFLLLTLWVAFSKTIFSEEGICRVTPIKTKCVPWDQVIQACVVPYDKGPGAYRFVFTFMGGNPWKNGQTIRFWISGNKSDRCISARYEKELCGLVLKCYGTLDFDATVQ